MAVDLDNTLLQAIQKIPGVTAGEKFKFINQTANKIAQKNHYPENFPKPLDPLLNVEVAKILNKTNSIIEALQTSDALLCQRALQISNLFPTNDSPLLKWEYFYSELLSKVSLVTRYKLIKKVSQDLQNKDPKYAETFFLQVSKTYGQKDAYPLLLACSEQFLNQHILHKNVSLDEKYVQKLFAKYPSFVISYLKKGTEEETGNTRKKARIDLNDYKAILPNLIDYHFDDLVELLNYKYFSGGISFGKRRTKTFLKKGSCLLVENPKKYMPFLSLEIISKHLTIEEFIEMLSNLLPEKMIDFSYSGCCQSYLRHFSNEKKVSFALNAFKKVYEEELYDHPELIDSTFLDILPEEKRTKIARMKLIGVETDWNNSDAEDVRLYLPFNEIFETVISHISKQSDAHHRENLIKFLINHSKISHNKDNLLQILKYISTRHKNESANILSSIMWDLYYKSDFDDWEQPHFDIVIEMIKRRINNTDSYLLTADRHLLVKAIQYKFKQNQSLDDYMRLYLKLNPQSYDIFDCNEKQKICLEKIIDLITEQNDANKIPSIMNYLEMFNNIVKKQENKKKRISMINIEDHPKFVQFLEDNLSSDNSESVKDYTEEYNVLLFNKWFPEKTQRVKLETIFCILKTNYKALIDDWPKYKIVLIKFMENAETKQFIKKIRWYQDLPIQLVDDFVAQLKNIETFKVVEILGILIDGTTYQKLIHPLVSLKKVESNLDEALENEKRIEMCVRGMKMVNPTIPITYIKQYFDFMRICSISLHYIACRTPSPIVIDFASQLLNEKLPIAKQMIELLYINAPIEIKLNMFEILLNTNAPENINNFILRKLWKLLTQEPNERIWNLFENFLQTKIIEDQRILKDLVQLRSVPNEYVVLYIKRMLLIIGNLKIEGYPDLPRSLTNNILNQLNKSYAKILPNDFQRELIQKYMFEKFDNPLLFTHYLFDVYLRNDVENKIQFIINCLKKYVYKYLDEHDGTAKKTLSARKFIKQLVEHFVDYSSNWKFDMAIANSLYDSIMTVIKPWEDVQSYLFLEWIKGMNDNGDKKSFATLIGEKLHVWINIFGSEYLYEIVNVVKRFLEKNDTSIIDSDIGLLDFIESIIKANNNNAYICAAFMFAEINLFKNEQNCAIRYEKHYKKYITINRKLMETKIPTVQALLYRLLLD